MVDAATRASYEAEIAAAQWRAENPQLANAGFNSPSVPMAWDGTKWVVPPVTSPAVTPPPAPEIPAPAMPPGGHEIVDSEPPPPTSGGFINYDAVVEEGTTGKTVDASLMTSAPTPDAVPVPPDDDLDLDVEEPEFGTPEFTERYYNEPGQPGYVPGSDTVVEVDESDLDVNIVNTKTGESVTTGSLAGGYETLADDTRLLKSDLGKLDQDVQEVFKKEGYDAGVAYMDTKAKQAFDDWAKDKVKLADGQWVTAEFFDQLPDDLKDVAVTLGLKALQGEISRINSVASVDTAIAAKQTAALATLEPFKRDGGYDTAQFLRLGGSVQVLKDANFEDSDIKTAEDYNNRPVSLDGFQKEYFADRGWPMVSKAVAMLAPGRSDVREYNAHLKEANKAYIDKYGRGAVVSSVAGGTLSQVFVPAKALAPDVAMKDITAMDWAIGATQVAMIAVPVVGGVVGKAGTAAAKVVGVAEKGVTTASGGVFAADTAMNWNKMSIAGKGIMTAASVTAFLPILGGSRCLRRAHPRTY